VYSKANICTPKQTIILPEGKGKNEKLLYNTLPKYICKKPLPNSFLMKHQGKKCDLEIKEDDEEFDAYLMIVGKSTEWIVNGIKIRECLKEYQLKKNLPKMRP
ncbi:12584_t:CDS:1, partial [Acaulospora morrowiae]